MSDPVHFEPQIPEKFQSPFGYADLAAPPTARPARRVPRRRMRHALGVLTAGISVALLCVAIIVALSWIQSQAAVDVVKAQAIAMRQGNVEKAYGLFSTEYRAGMSLQTFRRWLDRQNRLANNHGVSIWGRSLRGETAVLWGSLQDELGRTYPIRYELIRESGNWRVNDLQIQSAASDSLPETLRFQHI